MAEQIIGQEQIKEIKEIIENLPYEQMAESYVQYQKYDKDFSEWDDETRRQFLKVYKGPGTGRSYIYNSTIDKIIKEIKVPVNEFKEAKVPDFAKFAKCFEELIKKHQENHTPRQVIRAMAIMLRPTTYCQIADPIKLREVYEFLYKNPSEKNASEWDEMNKAVQECLCGMFNLSNPPQGNSLDINNALEQFKKQLGNKNLNSKEDELKKFIISFIPWEIYDRKCKVESFKKRLENCGNLIFTGAPGTGKTYMAKKIAAKMIGCSDNELEKNAQFGFVQFHPSYDYTDFVEGLRPVKGTGNKGVDFELKDGVFKQFCIKALNNPDKPFVFVIDEINRGEMSKIFGELFFSIDPDYRGKQGAVQTQYANMVKWGNQFDRNLDNGKKGQFFVPKKVYIIGTMNDIDRSVESMDFAFRRRFAFMEVAAEDSMGMLGQLGTKANDARKAMIALNEALVSPEKGGLTYSYQIGGSYFLKLKPQKDNDVFISFEELWDFYLKGTLYEYFRGEPDAEKKMTILKKAYDDALKSKTNTGKKGQDTPPKEESVTQNETTPTD